MLTNVLHTLSACICLGQTTTCALQTTPPCSEGLRWHVFNQHIAISEVSIIDFEVALANTTDPETGERQLYRHNERNVQPLNGRTVWFHDTGAAKYQGIAGKLMDSSDTKSARGGDDRVSKPRRRRGD